MTHAKMRQNSGPQSAEKHVKEIRRRTQRKVAATSQWHRSRATEVRIFCLGHNYTPLLRRRRQAHRRNEGELHPPVRRTGGVRRGREADELVQWTNSSDERRERKRRAGSPRLRGGTEGASRNVHRIMPKPRHPGVCPPAFSQNAQNQKTF